jgi:hypothetical protein
MIFRRSISCWMFSMVAAMPATAASGHFAITTDRIAAAVSSSGVQVSSAQVTLLTRVVANIAEPELKVKSIDRSNGARAVARLECVNPEQCVPFMVTLHMDSQTATTMSDRPAPVITQVRPSAPAVRAGSPATLRLEGTHTHISLSVICLENGATGQTIRAASRDHRQVYKVQVQRDGTLEGRL